jgi:prolyl oligopeptidase
MRFRRSLSLMSLRSRLKYPPTPHSDAVDTYHGREIADPFRWLEDVDSAGTGAWIAAQNALTEDYLAGVERRGAIRDRLERVWNYERFSVPSREGQNYAFYKNSGLQNQSVLFVAPTLDGPARVLIDPNLFSADGTVALSGVAFSDDGARVAYAVSVSGSDWLEWHVRDVETGLDLPDIVRWSKFSGAAWRADGSGFFYSRYDEPGEARFKDALYYHKLYFHRLGSLQAEDVLVYERLDHKEWTISPVVSEDGRWLIIYVKEGTDPFNRIFIADLADPDIDVVELLPDADAKYEFLGNDGERFFFLTTLKAPRGRVVALDLGHRSIHELIPQTSDALDNVVMFGDRFVAQYLHDAHSTVRLYDLAGADAGEIILPGLGTASAFQGKRADSEAFFSFTSFVRPATVYRYDFTTRTITTVFTPVVDFDPGRFRSEQVFYTSEDGTRVPMFLTYKNDIRRDGTTPTILYGYGGFNISITPAFSPAILVWLELGGIYAVANLRGGGEYGEEWHLAGTKERKQNVFDDFIAGAHYLIDNQYTSPAKLAIMGGSNGGLLVGAAMTQAPELFGAALPAVAVMDMLRFQKFTIGWAWASDYGSSDDPEQFEWLLAYSPLHNLRPGTRYPPTLITTADHDDRVFPGHSFKFAARLQEVQGGDAPALIRIEAKAGHGAGKPTAKVISEVADRYAFLVRVLDIA